MPVDSIERLIPDQLHAHEVTGQLTLELHMERYHFASAQANPGRLLDIACGVGYGTRLLYDGHDQNQAVIGVDCSQESIEYARDRYGKPGIMFKHDNAMDFYDTEGFDSIVSLETIEHVLKPQALIEHLLQFLLPGGIFIGSVPTTPTVDANPHHMHDFTPESFRALMAPFCLQEIAALKQVQPFNPLTVLLRKEERLSDLRPHLGQYYLSHPRSFFQRLWSTARFGFANHYLTIAWRKPL